MTAPATELIHEPLPDLEGRRLAVVGADGFIGSHVTRLALRAGAHVDAFLLQSAWRLTDIQTPSLHRHALDRSHLARLDSVAGLRRVDTVLWLAYVPPAVGTDAFDHERRINVAAAKSAARLGVPVVFASSAAVYGTRAVVALDESMAPAPATPYAVGKLEAEEALRASGPLLRIATTYGPGENGPRAIPSFIRALTAGRPADIHGAGEDVHDYIHVADVAAAFLLVVSDPAPRILNVGSARGRTTLEILATVAEAIGLEARVRHIPSERTPANVVLDVSAMRKLGWEPRVDLLAGLREEAHWLQRYLAACG